MSRKKEAPLQEALTNQEEFDIALGGNNVYVIDAYTRWSGPCSAITSLLRRLRNEVGDDILKFATADVDAIETLENYRGKCEPNFLIYGSGYLIGAVRGCNAPLLTTTVHATVKHEKAVQEEGIERIVISENFEGTEPEIVSDEEDADEEDDEMVIEQQCKKQVTVAVLKPDVVANDQVDEILTKIAAADIDIVDQMELLLTEDETRVFYQELVDEEYFEELINYMTSGPCRVIVLTKGETGEGIVDTWREMIGPFDAAVAKENDPASLRALYGTDAAINGMHGSSTPEAAMREVAFFFREIEIPTYMSKTVVSRPPSGKLRKANRFGKRLQRTLAIIRPDALQHKAEIIAKIEELGMAVAMQKEIELTVAQAEVFYLEHSEKEYFEALVKQMTSGPLLALCLTHEDAVNKWKSALGPKTIEELEEHPTCLRAQFHVEEAEMNMLHGSDTTTHAENELRAFFEVDQTLAIIKPDSFLQRETIIDRLEEAGLTVSYQKTMNLTKEIVSELYKNKQEASFYDQLIDMMVKGPSLMIVLSAENAIKKLRKFLGPVDPKRARRKHRHTLRAQFGVNILENAVHAVSNEKDANENIELLFGESNFEWDGNFKSDAQAKPGAAVDSAKHIPRLRDLVPPVESESEMDDTEMSGEDDPDYVDEGPLALLPVEETVDDLDDGGAAAEEVNDEGGDKKPEENKEDEKAEAASS